MPDVMGGTPRSGGLTAVAGVVLAGRETGDRRRRRSGVSSVPRHVPDGTSIQEVPCEQAF